MRGSEGKGEGKRAWQGGEKRKTRGAATHIFSYTREGARGTLGMGATCPGPSE